MNENDSSYVLKKKKLIRQEVFLFDFIFQRSMNGTVALNHGITKISFYLLLKSLFTFKGRTRKFIRKTQIFQNTKKFCTNKELHRT